MARMQPKSPPPFARRFIIGFAAVVIGILGALWWQHYQAQFVFAVTVDGHPLGCVVTKDTWQQALELARAQAQTTMGVPVVLKSEVELSKIKPTSTDTVLSGDALQQACQAQVEFATQVWALTVGGVDVAYVRTQGEVKQVIAGLISDYEAAISKKGNTTILKAGVDRQVTYHQAEAPVDKVTDVDGAKKILLRGTDKTLVHVVQRGESLWGIANSASLTVADLRKANPDLANPNLLRVGQEINLIVPDPYVNLTSTERYIYIKYLPFAQTVREDSSVWPYEGYVEKPGVYGRSEVTVEIDRVNGAETARRFLSEKNLSQPTTQHYVQGTRVYPKDPNGLIWPAPGPITSRYGYRSGEFHHGMDIGATYGTAVMAVNGGTVTSAGWHGSLGNCVIIDHGNGFESYYAHLSVISVSAGDSVARGAVIGKVGNTGRSTGPHLHLELHQNGSSVNPLGYYPRGG